MVVTTKNVGFGKFWPDLEVWFLHDFLQILKSQNFFC